MNREVNRAVRLDLEMQPVHRYGLVSHENLIVRHDEITQLRILVYGSNTHNHIHLI